MYEHGISRRLPMRDASTAGAETGCRSCTESPMPCASRCALVARAAASKFMLFSTRLCSNSATSAVRFPSAGSSLRSSIGTGGLLGTSRTGCCAMIFFKLASSSVGDSSLPAFDHAMARSLQPRPSTRMRTCSLSAASFADLLFSFASFASACVAVRQHEAAPHLSK
eukprot:6181191-Pleurochrysis_carterae.AAC.2